jgi:hypothetical protein
LRAGFQCGREEKRKKKKKKKIKIKEITYKSIHLDGRVAVETFFLFLKRKIKEITYALGIHLVVDGRVAVEKFNGCSPHIHTRVCVCVCE